MFQRYQSNFLSPNIVLQPKNLVLSKHWFIVVVLLVTFKSIHCGRQKLFIVFVSGKFSEVIACNEKGQCGLGYGHKIMMKVGE